MRPPINPFITGTLADMAKALPQDNALRQAAIEYQRLLESGKDDFFSLAVFVQAVADDHEVVHQALKARTQA